ncbi:hypothetical protein [Paenibacillus gansuensis]|uniref:Uncharacterized protein n=1 Tax=Paenibacillus gansuensis TaxID=306542 RepID=A0ABW5PJD6_9BACL
MEDVQMQILLELKKLNSQLESIAANLVQGNTSTIHSRLDYQRSKLFQVEEEQYVLTKKLEKLKVRGQ